MVTRPPQGEPESAEPWRHSAWPKAKAQELLTKLLTALEGVDEHGRLLVRRAGGVTLLEVQDGELNTVVSLNDSFDCPPFCP